MSMGQQISFIKARYEEANRNGDQQELLDVVAADMPVLIQFAEKAVPILWSVCGPYNMQKFNDILGIKE